MSDIVPIFFACDQNYAKYALVTIKSIMENSNKDRTYSIHVLNTDITEEFMEAALGNVKMYENCILTFENVSEYYETIKDKLFVRDYYSTSVYYRFFISELHPEYNKAIYIDADTIVNGDIAELYDKPLGNNLVGGCHEQAMVQTDVYGDYVEKNIGLDRYGFFNAGMLLINCQLFREECVLEQFVELLSVYRFRVTQDEDYLNVICRDRVLWVGDQWNCEVYGKINYDETTVRIVHYIMWSKPWHFEDVPFAGLFWKYAKLTPYYDEIVETLKTYPEEAKQKDMAQAAALEKLAIDETNRPDTFVSLKKKTKSVSRLKVLRKIKELEELGKFDVDAEEDPESRPIEPGEVDYRKRKIRSKFKTRFAYFIARRFLNKMVRTKQIIVKDIIGKENLGNLNGGAIVTCNHFNAFDSFAIEIAYEASISKKVRKHKKFYRVIREGNYTSFPGFYGFLMRNCYTLPLATNKRALAQFMKSTNELLADGQLVLVYPEQSMWWNYRKPKPLKRGAFQFSVKNNVPVVPCFICMEDSSLIDNDGFPIQEYTIFIEKPIYPDPNKNKEENITYLMEENYRLWVEIYEKFYGKKLEYDVKSAE